MDNNFLDAAEETGKELDAGILCRVTAQLRNKTMTLKNKPRRQARRLVRELCKRILDTEIPYIDAIPIDWRYYENGTLFVVEDEIWLPFLQRLKLGRAIRTRIAHEARQTLANKQ